VLYDFIASGDSAGRANCEKIWKNGVFAGRTGQDRASGDYNDFWSKRDLLPHVKNIKAAVLLAHGLNDYNVVPSHSVRIYDEMKRLGLPVSMYLHQGGHGGNPPADMVNRWFSHYLYGVNNGVEKDAPVWICKTPPQEPEPLPPPTCGRRGARWRRGDDSAAATSRTTRTKTTLPPTPFASFPVQARCRRLSSDVGQDGTPSLVHARSARTSSSTTSRGVGARTRRRAIAEQAALPTPTLTDTVHLGTVITLRVASSVPATNLTVWLVMPYDSARTGTSTIRASLRAGGRTFRITNL
jgi:X-Pro dipeptidyl-peptidase